MMAIETKTGKYYSTEEAAERLGISPNSLRVYASKKKIESVKLGNCLFFHEKVCKAFKQNAKGKGRPKKL